jgi:hypothetical protein
MGTVTKVNVRGAGFIPLDKCPRAWPRECVTGLIVFRKIGFILHDDSPTSTPNELRANQFAGATQRIALKEWPANKLFLHWRAGSLLKRGAGQAITASKACCFVKDR